MKHGGWALLLCLLVACAPDNQGSPGEGATVIPYDYLSTYGFFQEPMAALQPVAGVLPYTVNAPLWSDNAQKTRFLVLPEGQHIDFDLLARWSFPQGTILIKNFIFSEEVGNTEGPRRVVETRLLVYQGEDWKSHVYLWNDAQNEASRMVAGTFVDIEYRLEDGAPHNGLYVVPNTNQCKNCHGNDDRNLPIGTVTRQLNAEVERNGEMVNQLTWLAEQGAFSGPLPNLAGVPTLADPEGDGGLEERARAFLDANCAHCHSPGGDGGTSGLVLLASEADPNTYGVCKRPVAAGSGSGDLSYDIVPGAPDESIIIYRLKSLDPQIKMPEIPNLLVPERDVQLISDWISAMEPTTCGATTPP
jgi:uncharacterized repeat protein (TIGR03806 family)